jgi:hypothetical protein
VNSVLEVLAGAEVTLILVGEERGVTKTPEAVGVAEIIALRDEVEMESEEETLMLRSEVEEVAEAELKTSGNKSKPRGDRLAILVKKIFLRITVSFLVMWRHSRKTILMSN